MDSTSLSLCRALCCINDGQRQVFDLVFQRYILGDELGHYRKVLDKVVEDCNMLTTAMASVYSFLFPSLNFDVDNDEDELMAALIVALLAKDCRGDVIRHQRLNWHCHIKSLKRQGLFR
jgi:hypothetical protein